LALTIGRDGYALLAAAFADDAPAWLRAIPAVETLRRAWVQHYRREEAGVHWRASGDLPPAAVFSSSPHDDEAQYARKRSTQWVGYTVHVTETCDDDRPHRITNVDTTAGPADDGTATPAIHAARKQRDLLPRVHIVDTGFLDAALLVASRGEYGVALLGPVRGDHRWQARAGEGFDAQHFHIEWEHQRATCPGGRTSSSWRPDTDRRGNPVISVKFAAKECGPCANRPHCCGSRAKYPRRMLTVLPKAHFEALQATRRREATPSFAATYAARAGIESTLARGIRCCRLCRTRYHGQARVHLGHSLAAVGRNFLRLGAWYVGTPRPKPRRFPFAALVAETMTTD